MFDSLVGAFDVPEVPTVKSVVILKLIQRLRMAKTIGARRPAKKISKLTKSITATLGRKPKTSCIFT